MSDMSDMNENHSQDKETQQYIDRLLAGETITNDPLLNAMIETRPQASTIFQDTLESQLLAQLDSAEVYEEENVSPMNIAIDTSIPTKQTSDSQIKRHFPVTLIAAMLAIMIFGGFLTLMFNSGGSEDIYLSGAGDDIQQDADPEALADCPFPADSDYILYAVVAGDTLSSISENFDISVGDIAEANCFYDGDGTRSQNTLLLGDNIQAGDTLRIPVLDNECYVQRTSPDPLWIRNDTRTDARQLWQVQSSMLVLASETNADSNTGAEWYYVRIQIGRGTIEGFVLVSLVTEPAIHCTANAPGQVSNPVDVVVATRDLSSGTVLDLGDVETVSILPEQAPAFAYCCLDFVLGREITADVSEGAFVTEFELGQTVGDTSNAPGQIQNPAQVVVAAQDLAVGTVLERGDLETVSIMPDNIDQPFVFCCVDLLLGREVIAPVTAGAFVTENVLGLNPETGTINGQVLDEPNAGSVPDEVIRATATQLMIDVTETAEPTATQTP